MICAQCLPENCGSNVSRSSIFRISTVERSKALCKLSDCAKVISSAVDDNIKKRRQREKERLKLSGSLSLQGPSQSVPRNHQDEEHSIIDTDGEIDPERGSEVNRDSEGSCFAYLSRNNPHLIELEMKFIVSTLHLFSVSVEEENAVEDLRDELCSKLFLQRLLLERSVVCSEALVSFFLLVPSPIPLLAYLEGRPDQIAEADREASSLLRLASIIRSDR